MANLYGVANAPGLPVYTQFISGTDIACPGGVNTAIWTSPNLIAPSQGYFYALAFIGVEVTAGATAPTGYTAGIGIGAGTMTNGTSIPGTVIVANGTLYFTIVGISASSQVAWQGAGSPITCYISPGVNSATVKAFSSGMAVLLRAPDQ